MSLLSSSQVVTALDPVAFSVSNMSTLIAALASSFTVYSYTYSFDSGAPGSATTPCAPFVGSSTDVGYPLLDVAQTIDLSATYVVPGNYTASVILYQAPFPAWTPPAACPVGSLPTPSMTPVAYGALNITVAQGTATMLPPSPPPPSPLQPPAAAGAGFCGSPPSADGCNGHGTCGTRAPICDCATGWGDPFNCGK